MFFSAFMFTSVHVHFPMSLCGVEGVFYKGCNPLPLLLLKVFDVFSWFLNLLFLSEQLLE